MNKGNIYAIGGALHLTPDNPIIKRFFAECGRTGARLVVIPSCTDDQDKISHLREMHVKFFKDHGMRDVTFFAPKNGRLEDSVEQHRALRYASGVFLTGGMQAELMELLRETKILEIIRQRVQEEGVPIAGTSAGCAVLSETIILGGLQEPEMGKGIGLANHILLDQHFSSGNMEHRHPRFERLLKAIYANPHLTGVGVDEDTCALIKPDGSLEVLGSATVTIIEGENVKERVITRDEKILHQNGIKVSILASSAVFTPRSTTFVR